MHPKILIVGTVPYNTKSSSRAFESYFHYWEPENCAQIFSDSNSPAKGHCGTLYQLTDYNILQNWLHPKKEPGEIYCFDDLSEMPDTQERKVQSVEESAYKLGRTHTPFIRLMRGILWGKRHWCTKQFLQWLDDFKPECVFLSFSNDFFIPRIAYFVAQRFNIPIVSSIGDDYYFNKETTINPAYYLYKALYKSLIRKVLSWKGSAIYISDKIRDKYNTEFRLDGKTVYLTSTVQRKQFCPIDRKKPLITYFGNIRMGRNESLCLIGKALTEINADYRLEVYSNEVDHVYTDCFQDVTGISYGGSIPYEKVKEKIQQSDITVIVEGFDANDIEKSRYSLSTKAADSLAGGTAILVFGSPECGIIQYMQDTQAAMVCTDKTCIKECIEKLIDDEVLQSEYYQQAICITEKHHNLKSSCRVFENVVNDVIRK